MKTYALNVLHLDNQGEEPMVYLTEEGQGYALAVDSVFEDYTLGKLPPNYPVPAIRCDLVIWFDDEARSKPHGLSIISDNGQYIEEQITYSYGKTFGYGVALANL